MYLSYTLLVSVLFSVFYIFSGSFTAKFIWVTNQIIKITNYYSEFLGGKYSRETNVTSS